QTVDSRKQRSANLLRLLSTVYCLLSPERPGGFEPPHPPWQGGRLPGYIMDATSLSRASGGSRTHTRRITSTVLCLLSFAGVISIPVRNRTPSSTFEPSRASTTLRGCQSEPRPGIEPGPRPSESRVLSVAPPGPKIRGLESNQHSRVQGPLAYQLADPGVEW